MKHNLLITDNINSSNKADLNRSKLIRTVGKSLAKKMKAKVDLLFVEDLSEMIYLDYAKEIQEEHINELKKIKKSSPNLSTHFKVGSPSQEIIKYINKTSPELVIMGTQGKKGIEKLFMGSVAEEVLRNSKKPVMVLGPQIIDSRLDLSKKVKILLATDLTETSKAAEKYALSLAKKLNAEVTILYSEWEQIKHLQETMYVTGLPIVMLDDPTDGMKKYYTKEMNKKKKSYEKNKLSCNYIISDTSMALDQLILKVASKDYSIIVMGTQNRNKILKAFLGSNARKVILNSPIPVIVVHS